MATGAAPRDGCCLAVLEQGQGEEVRVMPERWLREAPRFPFARRGARFPFARAAFPCACPRDRERDGGAIAAGEGSGAEGAQARLPHAARAIAGERMVLRLYQKPFFILYFILYPFTSTFIYFFSLIYFH
jgi:hypothetical protein